MITIKKKPYLPKNYVHNEDFYYIGDSKKTVNVICVNGSF